MKSELIQSDVSKVPMELELTDNGGRRWGMDRRRFSYTDYIPERRIGQERRNGLDRRSGLDRRNGNDRTEKMNRRKGLERRAAFRV